MQRGTEDEGFDVQRRQKLPEMHGAPESTKSNPRLPEPRTARARNPDLKSPLPPLFRGLNPTQHQILTLTWRVRALRSIVTPIGIPFGVLVSLCIPRLLSPPALQVTYMLKPSSTQGAQGLKVEPHSRSKALCNKPYKNLIEPYKTCPKPLPKP